MKASGSHAGGAGEGLALAGTKAARLSIVRLLGFMVEGCRHMKAVIIAAFSATSLVTVPVPGRRWHPSPGESIRR